MTRRNGYAERDARILELEQRRNEIGQQRAELWRVAAPLASEAKRALRERHEAGDTSEHVTLTVTAEEARKFLKAMEGE